MKRITTSKSTLRVGFKGIVNRTDESVLDFAYSPKTFNFTFRGGALKGDLGIAAAVGRFPEDVELYHAYPAMPAGVEIENVFPYFRRKDGVYDDRLVVQGTDGKLYYTKIFSIDTWHEITGVTFDNEVSAVNYNYNGNDVLLVSSPGEQLAVLNAEQVTRVAAAPDLSSLAVHYERIYGSVNGEANQIWFSDDFDPTNWTVGGDAAGFVNFADECGDVLRVVSFLNYLYIFREHGIFRLTAYGDQSQFSLKKLFTDTGRIYKNTISLCGDRIIFLAEEGLFAFDGYDVGKIAQELPKIRRANDAVGAYFNGRYYLGCRLDETEFPNASFFNNAIVEYDLSDKSIGVLAPVDPYRLVPCNVHNCTSLLVVLAHGETAKLGEISKDGSIFGTPTQKVYYSPRNDMGFEGEKLIRQATLTTKTALNLIVKADGREARFDVEGKDGPQTVFIGLGGRRIGFELRCSQAEAEISPITVRVETMRGSYERK